MRVLELICFRDKNLKRETKVLGILTYLAYTVWKVLFGKQADSLEKSTEQEDECRVLLPVFSLLITSPSSFVIRYDL